MNNTSPQPPSDQVIRTGSPKREGVKPIADSCWRIAFFIFNLSFSIFNSVNAQTKSAMRADSIIAKRGDNSAIGIIVTDTIGSTGNTNLIFKTNNVEGMRIAANGNVGIGTTNPFALFHTKNILVSPTDTGYTGNIYTGTATRDGITIGPSVDVQRNGGACLNLTKPINYTDGGLLANFRVNNETKGSISFNSTNNGIVYYSLNNTQFQTNGVERMRIDQNGNVGIGTNGVPNASAILELQSNSSGLLLPRLDPKQITNASKGTLIYNTSSGCLNYHNDTAWVALCPGGNSISPWTCGDSLIDKRDGQRSAYSTKDYGTAGCWMTQNLRYYPGGTVYINTGANGSTTGVATTSAAAIHDNTSMTYYENTSKTVTRDQFTQKFGVLYSWNQAMNSTASTTTTNSVQGICPAGWYMPTDNDFVTLANYLGSTTTAGTLMKADGNTYGWDNATTYTWSGTNTSGFNGYPSGAVYNSTSSYFGMFGSYWTATEKNSTDGYNRLLFYNNTAFNSDSNPKSSAYFTLRCRK